MQRTTVTALVVEVIDGDTFVVASGDRIRLSDVCAPEKGQPGWEKARDVLAGLILAKYVTIDPVARDKFGRIVADVWVNHTYVNETMRRAGYRC